jgi:hypothetical protein
MGPRWVPDTKADWPTGRRSQNNFNFSFILDTEFGRKTLWKCQLQRMGKSRDMRAGIKGAKGSEQKWLGTEASLVLNLQVLCY